MPKWHSNLCDALLTDSRGLLQQKHPGVAQVIKSELLPFPDLTAIVLYTDLLTLWSNGHVPPENNLIMACQPDLPAIGDFCSQNFSLSGNSLVHKLKDICAGVVTCALLQVCTISHLYSFNKLIVFGPASWKGGKHAARCACFEFPRGIVVHPCGCFIQDFHAKLPLLHLHATYYAFAMQCNHIGW